jgi:CitMHS family citrate-Mg2+:H+ or citrate-Ca2+:H+ symporter
MNIVAVPAMLPLYDRLGMSRLTLTVCTGMGAGVMNLLPWGGPTARAATATGIDVNTLWVPLIPAQIVGLLGALAIAWHLGRREHRRLLDRPGGAAEDVGVHSADAEAVDPLALSAEEQALRRPGRLWLNVLLTVAVLVVLVAGWASPEMTFLFAVVIALVVNYPGLKEQTARIEAHSMGAMLMATTLLAAGAFLGIIEGSGMIEAMAVTAAGVVPEAAAPALPLIVGTAGVPLSLLFGPDAYYFGVMPVLTALGEQYGVPAESIAQASMLGEETVGFPISPLTGSFYLLVGLAGVDIGKHIKALFGWAWLLSMLMLVVAIATGAIPLWAN